MTCRRVWGEGVPSGWQELRLRLCWLCNASYLSRVEHEQPTAQTDEPPPDRRGRLLRDLRVSVTDRCNFRCRYCMPRERAQSFLPKPEILSFEEIGRVARAAKTLGMKKIRITGGEPLLRRDLPVLVEQLAGLSDDLAMTTNGVLLPQYALDLRRAGLERLTISLDALDDTVFQRMADAPAATVSDVLAGLDAAEQAGFGPVKINCVVRRGVNDDQVIKLVERFAGSGHVLRFIEYMDVGSRNGWRLEEVVSHDELVGQLRQLGSLDALTATQPGEVARRYLFSQQGRQLEVGLISSVSQPFCGSCTRARLSADGRLYTCLFAHQGHDLRRCLRQVGAESLACDDRALEGMLRQLWSQRDDRYSELRGAADSRLLPVLGQRVEMSFIGG